MEKKEAKAIIVHQLMESYANSRLATEALSIKSKGMVEQARKVLFDLAKAVETLKESSDDVKTGIIELTGEPILHDDDVEAKFKTARKTALKDLVSLVTILAAVTKSVTSLQREYQEQETTPGSGWVTPADEEAYKKGVKHQDDEDYF